MPQISMYLRYADLPRLLFNVFVTREFRGLRQAMQILSLGVTYYGK